MVALLVVTLPHLVTVDWHAPWGTEVLVVNTLLGPTWFVASGLNIGGEQKKKKKREKEESGNLPLPSTISNSSYRPGAWGLNGGGEKRLNEQSERYLLLPPLT